MVITAKEYSRLEETCGALIAAVVRYTALDEKAQPGEKPRPLDFIAGPEYTLADDVSIVQNTDDLGSLLAKTGHYLPSVEEMVWIQFCFARQGIGMEQTMNDIFENWYAQEDPEKIKQWRDRLRECTARKEIPVHLRNHIVSYLHMKEHSL